MPTIKRALQKLLKTYESKDFPVHLTPCLGAETHGLKFRSEATQPMCLRPSEPASDYSSLLCDFVKITLDCLLVLLKAEFIRTATIERFVIDQP